MGLFNKKNEDDIFQDSNDVLIIWDHETMTSKIRRITEVREQTVYVNGEHAIPVQDCTVTNSEEGRHFLYKAPSRSVEETERLAKLEKSIVLNNITEYEPEEEGEHSKLNKWLIVTIMIGFVAVAISSCAGG